ncbi:MAG: chemotaxis protein, partial [Chloroflexota bacterium]|nr:chemotaxis protein [Chloroflexota bacterium]
MPIAAIGGGEGSLPALAAFFEAMPADTGMTFVVLQHTSAEGDLAEYLRRHTTMSVATTTESTTLRPNYIFAVPSDKSVVIDDGTLKLSERDRPEEQAAPIDLLFRTLATIHGPESAGIVLSGAGSDGSMGLERVKEMGGLTLAQDPMEAEVGAMPRNAVATGMVDVVLPAAELPAKLIDYWRRATQAQLPATTPLDVEPDEAVLREIFALMRMQTGHDFSQYKRSTILRRIGRRMQVTNADTLGTYLTLLRSSVEETRALLRDFLISVTNFFRDREAWGALEEVIPRLFAGKQAGDQVRVWVTGCATGEEAYSVAILLHERAALLDEPPAIQVFATDIDDDAILAARQGIYPETIAVDVEPARLRRYFVAEAGHFRIKQEIRDLVLFAPHNLLRDPPFSRLDLVTCRNVLIYLNRGVQEQILRLFHFALRSDGYLLLGSSESTDGVPDLFAPVDRGNRLFQRRPVLNIAPFLTTDLPLPPLQQSTRHRPSVTDQEARPSIAALHQRLILDHAAPSILVNASNEIIHVTAGAGRFLQFSEGEPSQNLFDLALPDLRMELRTALFAASQNGGQVVTRHFPLQLPGQDGQQLVELIVRPIQQLEWAHNFSLIELREIAGVTQIARHTGNDVEPMVRQLEEELQRTKDQLRLTIEQYETA